MKRIITLFSCLAAVVTLGCSDAKIASQNLSQAAENFEIARRVVFYNGITDSYMLVIEGRCSIEDDRYGQLEVTCKTGRRSYTKHFLGLSDNVTYFAEQLIGADVSTFHHRIIFKPQAIIPDIDFRGSTEALLENSSEFEDRMNGPTGVVKENTTR